MVGSFWYVIVYLYDISFFNLPDLTILKIAMNIRTDHQHDQMQISDYIYLYP